MAVNPVRSLVRSDQSETQGSTECVSWSGLGDGGGQTLDPALLAGCHTLVHLAARAHRMGDHPQHSEALYQSVNVQGSVALMLAAMTAGVRRMVFLSSIKVAGEASDPGCALQPNAVAPQDAYGRSKRDAELALSALAAESGMELVILRPPLIHGPGAKGNLQRLLSAIAGGKRLPLGSVRANRRSLLGLENAASAIVHAATAPWPGGASRVLTYHLSDEGVISTRRLVEVLAAGLGVSPRLLPLPRWAALAAAYPLGKAAAVRRLFGNLEVDASAFTQDWGWRPQVGPGACRGFDHGAALGPGRHFLRWKKLTIALLFFHFSRLGSATQSTAPGLGRIRDKLLEDGLTHMAKAWRERGGWPG